MTKLSNIALDAPSSTTPSPVRPCFFRVTARSRPWLASFTVFLVALVASVDLFTGEELSFFVFYFVPVCFAAWFLHLRFAVAAALLSTIGWLAVEVLSGHTYSHSSLLVTNLLIRFFSYTLIGYLFFSLRLSRSELYNYAAHLEERVAERTALLQQRVSELEMLSYATSHNLRAPLRAIEGMTHAVEECLQENRSDLLPPYLDRIKSSAIRMDHLLLDLIQFVQLTIHDAELHAIELDPVLRDILASFSTEISQKRASISVAAPLPVVWANKRLLSIVLHQVLSNALKFVPPGATPQISISAAPLPNQLVRINIQDQGIGISPQHQQRIFELFEQLHPYDRFGGTGMGLALARRSIEKLGGHIGCISELGHGATFWIELRQHHLQSTLNRPS